MASFEKYNNIEQHVGVRDKMGTRYEHEDQSGLRHFGFVFTLIFITFQLFFIFITNKSSVDILYDVRNICMQKISVDSEISKKEWQLNQIELIRKALATDPNLHPSTSKTRSYDVAEGPGFKSSIVQKKYDPALMDNEAFQGTELGSDEIDRTPAFYMNSKYAVRIGSLFFRLSFIQRFSRWFIMWYRSNSQLSPGLAGDSAVRDTYMKVNIYC